MRKFVKRWRRHSGSASEKGFTLVELIASLTLLSVVLGVIYSSITFGLNTYNKVRIENSLRDEGDLIMSSIITQLYALGPEKIVQSDNGSRQSIELVLPKTDADQTENPSFVIRLAPSEDDPAKTSLYLQDEDPDTTDEVPLTSNIRINTITLNYASADVTIDKNAVAAGSTASSVANGSYILLQCRNSNVPYGCSTGLIHIGLRLSQTYDGRDFELVLNSKFGF
ncbi:prepilin-type N-terminal cleavage/methylation domain-containing protein [Paenibacillus phyllosphaerae]|uniref:Prepilin-type N-terminal cleavage/methylation domain-containing protein n=1 Tax=Paenibacillus phyllosphaerae TaxID=274593 RepID=A0A7W5ATZ3_9BACL|nr:prepilin-type N-terminal cleavage/methylation domain-containing protein [Paenibacillus phyllosphaerae]MBB3108735.1 prepilin-type N-terminal cleavage/methylation domain-containing protein [Paenibacillus phyllosphaerae]